MSWIEFWITLAAVAVAMPLIYILTARFRRPKKVAALRKKTFLEEALEDDVERPRPAVGYTWDDLQRDLYDSKLTLNEIMEKCGGVLPKKPGKGAAQGPESGPEEPKGRLAELQAWFGKRAQETPVLKVVPPPPQPPPVVTLSGQSVRCPYCAGSGQAYGNIVGLGRTESFFNPMPAPPAQAGSTCSRCKGHGYVIVSGS